MSIDSRGTNKNFFLFNPIFFILRHLLIRVKSFNKDTEMVMVASYNMTP